MKHIIGRLWCIFVTAEVLIMIIGLNILDNITHVQEPKQILFWVTVVAMGIQTLGAYHMHMTEESNTDDND